MAGCFIVLEGIDGSGTTTQAELLAETLRARGAVELTREPTAGPVGLLIRQVLQGSVKLTWSAMALLFAADRQDHASCLIQPAIERGAVVVSDRYLLSSLIYQSTTGPDGAESLAWLREINRSAPTPDLTLVLHVSAEHAEARRKARGGKPELYETTELQRKLALAYARATELLPTERVLVIDGEGTVEEVRARVFAAVDGVLSA